MASSSQSVSIHIGLMLPLFTSSHRMKWKFTDKNRSILCGSKRALLPHHQLRWADYHELFRSLRPRREDETRQATSNPPRYIPPPSLHRTFRITNCLLCRRWLSMGTRLHSSHLHSTLLKAIRHHDSSGKVRQQLPTDSSPRTIYLVQETAHHRPHDDHRSSDYSERRVLRTATCSRANKNKNTIQHQCL
jgi:hypothetical protein